MKKFFSLFVALFLFVVANAQEEHSIIIDQSSFRPIHSDATTGVNIDPIGVDTSRRPCARIKVKINRMTREEIDKIDVKIHTNNELTKCKTAEHDYGLILEMTAKSATTFYFHHPEYGYSNNVTLDLEANKEYYLEASLNQTFSIVVDCNVTDADVYIDDVFKGRTGSNYSLIVSEVIVGQHKLKVNYGGMNYEQNIVVNKSSIQFRQIVNKEASKPQFVVFVVQPENAMLMIDNRVQPLQDGAVSIMLENGTYSYSVTAPDYHPVKDRFTVSGSKVEKVITLNPAYGWITIDSQALAGATIFIDDQPVGVAPINKYKLSSGKHKVQIVKELYKSYTNTVTITDNNTTAYNPQLSQDYAEVVIDAPNDSEIWVNNVKKGVGSWSGKLQSGVYLFEARKENHRTSSISQTISASSTTQRYTLPLPTPITGTLIVTGSPVMADVALDGKNIGRVPLSLDNVIIGNRNVTVSKDGYVNYSQSVLIEEGKSSTVNVALKKYVASALKGVTPIDVDTTLSADKLNNKGSEFYDKNDFNSAVQYFFAAAEKGHSTAQSWMGFCYEYGKGVEKDYAEAVKWYRKSANQGSAYAANRLAECYYYGRGVEKSYAEAVKFYRPAADNGNKNAQYSLGWCYEKGNGVTQNIAEAKVWYGKAAAQGHDDAQKRLDELSGKSSSSYTSNKTYKVGDLYNENGLKGVVFEVSADGRSGKIVSMKQSQDGKISWALGHERKQNIGATNSVDGQKNMEVVQRISDWRNKYPAFAWCADLGNGWYLPAIEELKKFTLNDNVRDAVNKTLEANGGDKIFTKSDPKYYWSSSEVSGKTEVNMVLMNYNEVSSRGKDFTDNYSFSRIRAVAKFGNGSSNSSSSSSYSSSSNYSTSGKSYKVGDLYNENGLKGVVFQVSTDGRSGKIVNLKQPTNNSLGWAVGDECKRNIGTTDHNDGQYNMNVVKGISNWQSKYPAFAWCASLGSAWYLPAINELEMLLKKESVLNKVNATIEANGGDKLSKKGDPRWYWSSTEGTYKTSKGYCSAILTRMNFDDSSAYEKNMAEEYTFTRVIAIAKFGNGSSNSSSGSSYSSSSNYSTSGKSYKVGDLYNENGLKGVVFEVSADGRSGKIVSLEMDKTMTVWCKDSAESKRTIGAGDPYDGEKNTAAIKRISGWQSKYPPVAWCDKLGSAWYLPSKNELETIQRNKSLIEPKLTDKLEDNFYFSSTESNTVESGIQCVYDVGMKSGGYLKTRKSYHSYTRAVAKFNSSSSSYSSSSNSYSSSNSGSTYRVGDICTINGVQGVVFEVDSSGRHGKVVSVKASGYDRAWALGTELKKFLGATDKYDGEKNMAVVKRQSDWRNKYPAFAWCADLGDGWYLPAKEELAKIRANKSSIEPKLSRNLEVFIWSSTENNEIYKDEYCAWYQSNTGNVATYSKSWTNVVFAVHKF